MNVINDRLDNPSRPVREVRNPATEELVALLPLSTSAEIAQAVAAAKAAQPGWERRSDEARKAALRAIAAELRANVDHLATIITREQGKPLGDDAQDDVPGSRHEVRICAEWAEVLADLSLGVRVLHDSGGRRDELHHRPLGVIGAITSSDWPLLEAAKKILPAVRAGNAVVLKPSERASLAVIEMVRLIAPLLPPGLVNVVTGGAAAGARLCDDPWVDKVVFSGSGPVATRIAAAAARNLTPTAMALGGNDAAIVLADANPRRIARSIFWAAFSNSGQYASGIKRLYVPESLRDALVVELKALADATPMGNGMQPGVMLGPVGSKEQLDRLTALIDEARALGAWVVCGGEAECGRGFFLPVTLVTHIEDGAALVDEEQSGPVLPIIAYREVEEAVEAANGLGLALGASVWSGNLESARKVASLLDAGTVWINQHGSIRPGIPISGRKGSGDGVDFGLEGLRAFTRPHVVSLKNPSVEAPEASAKAPRGGRVSADSAQRTVEL